MNIIYNFCKNSVRLMRLKISMVQECAKLIQIAKDRGSVIYLWNAREMIIVKHLIYVKLKKKTFALIIMNVREKGYVVMMVNA